MISEGLAAVLAWSETLLVARLDRAGRIVEANIPLQRAAGRDLAGVELANLVSEERREELREMLEAAEEEPQTGILRLAVASLGPTGELRSFVQADDDGLLFVAEPPVDELRGLLGNVLDLNADLIELRLQLQRANERLRYLEAIGAVALVHRDLPSALAELLRLMRHVLEGDEATILLLDPDRNELVVEATLGRESELGLRIPVGRGIAGRIAEAEEPVVIDDVSRGEVVSGWLASRGGSFVGVPLRAAGRLIGVTDVTSARKGAFTESDVRLLQLVADRAALAIDNVREYQREREASLALQRSLLPEALAHVAGVELAARYLPATGEMEVGGDWFDAVALPAGRVGLAIGDVAGRGLQAATAMGRLSNALRAYALEHEAPGDVLSLLNRVAYEERLIATAVYIVLDPATGEARYASAGHLPPVVCTNGAGELLPLAKAPPLGAALDPIPDLSFDLPPGGDLVLYTDGLVERRDEPIDAGLARLRSIACGEAETPDDLCELVVSELLGGRTGEDDVAVLAARRASLA